MGSYAGHPVASPAGFTLIELLVVISIIALLTAMLLPSLQQAREAARRVTCLANQRTMGVGMLSFESDFVRLPNIKMAHGTLQTLEGQPWTDSSPGVNIYANYTGTSEYRLLLSDYMNARVAPLQNGRHIYINGWHGGHVLNCPSAEPNAGAGLFDDNFAADPNNGNPYGEFYLWGGLQMDLLPLGANVLYWSGNTPDYISWRRSGSPGLTNPREVVLAGEVCRIGTTLQGSNNHRGQGLNSVWFDLTGGWIPVENTVPAGFEFWAGGNRFGDAGISQYRIPSARWAQVGGGFRIQEFGVFFGNGLMNPAYPDQVQVHMAMIAKMGYARQDPNLP